MLANISILSCENVQAQQLSESSLPKQKDASSFTLRHLVALFAYIPLNSRSILDLSFTASPGVASVAMGEEIQPA